MSYGITDLTTYILGTIFIVLLPGPNSMYVTTVAARHGIATGYRAACGVFLGDTVLMILAAAGAASLLRTTPTLAVAAALHRWRRRTCAARRAPAKMRVER
jgi:leucine efflux protein